MAAKVASTIDGPMPGLARNNSIDPSTLSRPARRIRAGKRQSNHNNMFNDSGVTNSTAGSSAGDSQSSVGSKWESVKFSAKNFVLRKAGILEDFYDLGDLVGEGGFGEVFACTHLETGEVRAVKVMEKSLTDQSVNDSIIREYSILKDLDHPNILKVYEMYETKNHFFIVTDLYSGGDLFSDLEDNGCLCETNVAKLMNAILTCMNYCHKRNLCHLDLKPENVLIARAEPKSYSDVKIIDFGLARVQDASTKLTRLDGSSYYMSPQVVKRSYNGCKADVWSCGILVYVLMTGYAPFDGPTYDDVLKAITAGKLHFYDTEWEGVSEECMSFIRYCLTYDEDERPSAEQALQHPFLREPRQGNMYDDVRTRLSARKALKQLEGFNTQHSKLKQATCAIMASQLLSQDEKDHIDNVFRSLDTSCDGQLDKDDLRRSYKEFFDVELSEKEIDTIFEQVNFSASGVIEYSEFAVAIMMAENKMDESKMEAAFKVFDRDGKGYIATDDIKRVLQLRDEQDAYLKKKILRQVDAEETGTIEYEAFRSVMQSNASMRRERKPSMKRSSRRCYTSSESPKLDMKEVLGASLLDVSVLDFPEMLLSSCVNHDERPLRAQTAGVGLEWLEELDEDNSSGRETRTRKTDGASSQSSREESKD